MKIFNKLTNLLFIAFIFSFMALHIYMPDMSFSEEENRVLKVLPSLSLKKVVDGTYSAELQKYIQDQFPYRSYFVNARSNIELTLGKRLISGVFVSDDILVQQFNDYDEKRLLDNIRKINNFGDKVNKPAHLILIPNAAYVYADQLPENAPVINQEELIQYIYDRIGNVNEVDVMTAVKYDTNYPYYYTDHHLTLQGTAAVYKEYQKALNIKGRQYVFETLADDFRGTLSSKSGLTNTRPDIIERLSSKWKGIRVTYFEDGKETIKQSVYEPENLRKKDKYTYYLNGNQPMVTIETNQKEKDNLLIVADSYGHALAPFVIDDFNKITFVDLRYYKGSVSELSKDYDRILFYYGIESFVKETSIAFLK